MRRSTYLGIALALLALGLLVGWFVGRWQLEQSWAEPMVISAADVERSSQGDADPTPQAGTRVLAAMPLQRARHALHDLVASDPVQMTIGSIGRSDGLMELHLTLHNRGECEVTEVEGVAYGFDASGHSRRLNRGGEHYVAFRSTELALAPGASSQEAYPLLHPDTASIALAQVERVSCADGTRWSRQ